MPLSSWQLPWLLAPVLLATGADAAQLRGLGELVSEAKTDTYVEPSWKEVLRAKRYFTKLMVEGPSCDQEGAWARLSYELVRVSGDGVPPIWMLHEQPNDRRGRGVFAVRTGQGTPLFIQAPHRYYDIGTGVIARKLFVESDSLFIAWNSAPRYVSDTSDLAHTAKSYLQAMSLAFALLYPKGHVLQLHGFSSKKRTTRQAPKAQVIVSDGTDSPSSETQRLTACLKRDLTRHTVLYPRDVHELGATTNTIGRALRRRSFKGFLHMEMSRALRMRLIKDPLARGAIIGCLQESYR